MNSLTISNWYFIKARIILLRLQYFWSVWIGCVRRLRATSSIFLSMVLSRPTYPVVPIFFPWPPKMVLFSSLAIGFCFWAEIFPLFTKSRHRGATYLPAYKLVLFTTPWLLWKRKKNLLFDFSWSITVGIRKCNKLPI